MKKTKWIVAVVATLLTLFALSGCGGFSFDGRTIESGKVGVEYNVSIANGDEDMYYELDYDDNLPRGLSLSEDGLISGVPEEAGTVEFTVFATDANDEYKSAEFSITIEKGTIIYTSKELPDAQAGEPYLQNVGTASGASKIMYAVKEGTALPDGLEMDESGEISGVPEVESDGVTFTIVASAAGCDPVETSFNIKVEENQSGPTDLGRIVFEGWTLPDGLVGDEYNENIRKAYGVPGIKYTMRPIGGVGFPKGLRFNALGFITGTPSDSTTGVLRFNLVASAEGYSSVTVECRLRIYDVYVETDRFEAEYINVNALTGAGYSGGASGLSMIQKNSTASNGRVLGYLNTAMTFEFIVSAEQATTAGITLGLGSELWGTFELTPATFKIFINDVELDYGALTVIDELKGTEHICLAYDLGKSVNLIASEENVIRFQIFNSVDAEGIGTATAKGPLFDYVELNNYTGKVGWRPKVANIK